VARKVYSILAENTDPGNLFQPDRLAFLNRSWK
jgi:hypothetical protein